LDRQSAQCPYCHSQQGELYLELPDRFLPGRELYRLYSCRDCGLIFLNSLPEETAAQSQYPDAEYDPFLEVKGAQSLMQKIYCGVKPWSLKWKMRIIRRYQPEKGRILDVGTGTGAFLEVMKTAGWKTTGIEKEERAVRWGRDKFGLVIFCGDFADFQNFDSFFEVITFWHSLEHIHRFRDNLKQAHNFLTPNGSLFLALPNPASYEAKIYKRNWVAYDAPRHLWHFRPEVIQKILRDCGFRVVKIHAMLLDPFYNCLLSEGIVSNGNRLLRYVFRFPAIAGLSFIKGLVNPLQASSVIYVASKI
jgi:2-polyprenyl-3-methyl-5-hydroxy-6-metoxy-1,4-benzoquinol methylase